MTRNSSLARALATGALLCALAGLPLLSSCGGQSNAVRPAQGPGTSGTLPTVPPITLLGKTRSECDGEWGPGSKGSEGTAENGTTIDMYAYRPTGLSAVSAGFVDDRLVVAAIHLRKPTKTLEEALSAVGLDSADWKATGTSGLPYVPEWRWDGEPAPSRDAPAQVEFRRNDSDSVTRVKVFTQEGVEIGAGTVKLGPDFPAR